MMQKPGVLPWDTLRGEILVLDSKSPFVFLGRLKEVVGRYALLTDADVHDLRDGNTTRELYVLECRTHGVNPNRSQVWVDLEDIVGVSRLSEVLNYE